MKLYVAKVIWYCEGEDSPDGSITDYLVIAGEGFVDAMEQLEDYYGNDIDNVHLELINHERPLVRLPDEQTYEAIKEMCKMAGEEAFIATWESGNDGDVADVHFDPLNSTAKLYYHDGTICYYRVMTLEEAERAYYGSDD